MHAEAQLSSGVAQLAGSHVDEQHGQGNTARRSPAHDLSAMMRWYSATPRTTARAGVAV